MSREELLDGFPDGVGIVGIEIGGGVTTDLTQHRNVGHQYRTSATHCLDGRQAEPFVERGEDKAYGLVVKPDQFFVGDATEKSDRGQVPVRFFV